MKTTNYNFLKIIFRKWQRNECPPTKSLVKTIAAVWQLQQGEGTYGKRLDWGMLMMMMLMMMMMMMMMMIIFMMMITASMSLKCADPLLVQCDNGVKRAGTFAVIDNCCGQLEKTTIFDMVSPPICPKSFCILPKRRSCQNLLPN